MFCTAQTNIRKTLPKEKMDFELKESELKSVSATLAPAFEVGTPTSLYLTQTIRDPISGKLCLSSSEFVKENSDETN